jgi:ribonucleoside-triphosphate reductase
VNPIQQVTFADKYSRYNRELARRETWPEAIDRVLDFLMNTVADHALKLDEDDPFGSLTRPELVTHGEWAELRQAMLNQEVMCSMRVLQMAGPALDRCNVGAYNCAYLPIDSLFAFSELLYILMQGTGVGFSVESMYVDQLPRVKKQKQQPPATMIIEDSTVGWCEALREGLERWCGGRDVDFDYSQIRPQGAPLMTKGGRASGPEPLKLLLTFARERVLARQGQRLSTLDAHDIACYCGQIVQVGGVRRAAEISLSDPDDHDLRDAKAGQFWHANVQRSMANNSAVYSERPTSSEFLEEWLALVKSGTGERGIFNRAGVIRGKPTRRRAAVFGVNPCGEIVLRPRQFCNLSIAVARATDTVDTLKTKVKLAALLGTIQSLLTDFRYISPEWKRNCEEERLLGVDITGQADCPLLRPELGRDNLLLTLRQIVLNENSRLANVFGIPRSAATTCVKPSGNSAQLFDCSSGLHVRYAPYYIRRLRLGAYSPVAQFLKDAGVPFQPEVGQSLASASVLVFEFPIKSPEGAVTRHDVDAIDQLDNWLSWKVSYTEHNPSVTIYVDDSEWPAVGAWVYDRWEHIGGVSFLPKDGGIYNLAPYTDCSKAEYDQRAAAFPALDFSRLPLYEKEDTTTVNSEFACVGDRCSLD